MENGKRFVFFLVLKLVSSKGTDVELPLCPTNIQYLPQTLPMHCRMPRNANFGSADETNRARTMPPFIPPYFQSPPPEKAQPYPFPVPPPFPVMPGLQMPGAVPGPMQAPLPVPMPMPLNPGPAHKLPVIVMPFYSPDSAYTRKPPKSKTSRKPRYYSDDTDTDSTDCSSDTDTDSSSESSGRDGWWKSKRNFRRSGRRNHRHRAHRVKKKHRSDIVTPVLQYVNRNGYVIFEKKITKGEAKEWLKGDPTKQEPKEEDEEVIDMNFVQEEKQKEKPRPEEKPHHLSPPSQPPVRKHRQPKPSKEIKTVN